MTFKVDLIYAYLYIFQRNPVEAYNEWPGTLIMIYKIHVYMICHCFKIKDLNMIYFVCKESKCTEYMYDKSIYFSYCHRHPTSL